MSLLEAEEALEAIESSEWDSLARDLIRAAIRYARFRTDWALAEVDERREMDAERTRAHDAFIDCCNILSRNMASKGEDIGWRKNMGDDRRVIGDFACRIHCLLGIRAR